MNNKSFVHFLFFSLLILLHSGFLFRSHPKASSLDLYWVYLHNEKAIDDYVQKIPRVSSRNFIFSPLQNFRIRALTAKNEKPVFMVKDGAFEEQSLALRALLESVLQNQKHDMTIAFREKLLWDKRDWTNRPSEFSKAIKVKIEKVDFSKKTNILQKTLSYCSGERRRGIAPCLDRNEESKSAALSCVSFQGRWKDEFPKESIRETNFSRSSTVDMMQREGYVGYLSEEKFEAVDLRYGDGKVSLLVFLPRADSNLDEFYYLLTTKNWKRWMEEILERRGRVSLPQFEIKEETVAGQCTHFIVAPKGGQARPPMRIEGDPQDPEFNFEANRPFFFSLLDNQTDLILLMGQFYGRASTDNDRSDVAKKSEA